MTCFGAIELNYQNFRIKTFIAYEISSVMKIFCSIQRFSGWVEDKCWTDSLCCYKTEGFLSECIASYLEAVNFNWQLKVAVLTDITGMLNDDINMQEKASDYRINLLMQINQKLLMLNVPHICQLNMKNK